LRSGFFIGVLQLTSEQPRTQLVTNRMTLWSSAVMDACIFQISTTTAMPVADFVMRGRESMGKGADKGEAEGKSKEKISFKVIAQ
jgi:hypothetical protein